MAAVVPVERLVVVGRAGVLGPQLHFVQVEILGTEIALRRVDQVGVEGQAVEIP